MVHEHSRAPIRPSAALLDALWRLSVAPQAWAALSLAAAALIGLGLVLPQAPYDLAGGPADFTSWLASLQVQRGSWLAWPARLGLLSIYRSPLLRFLAAALAFVCLLTLFDGLLAWRDTLRRRSWLLLTCAGLLFLLSGALVEERWGWEQDRLLLGSGRPMAMGLGQRSLALQQPEGAVSAEDVPVLWREGALQGQARLRRGQPLILFPLTLHLLEAGPAVRLHVQDPNGQMISLDDPAAGDRLQSEMLLRFQKVGEEHILSLPARDWVVRITYRGADLGGAPFSLAVYRHLGDATPLAQAPLTGTGSLTAEQYRFEWQLLPYADLRAALHPGFVLGLLGWLALSLGLGLSLVGQGPGRQRSWWLWAPAALVLGALIWAVGGGASLSAQPLAGVSGFFLACGGAWLLLGAAAGLLTRLTRNRAIQRWPGLALERATALSERWPAALGWALGAWTVGGALDFVAHWAADGTLWHWEPGQACWAFVFLLLAAGWRLQRERMG